VRGPEHLHQRAVHDHLAREHLGALDVEGGEPLLTKVSASSSESSVSSV